MPPRVSSPAAASHNITRLLPPAGLLLDVLWGSPVVFLCFALVQNVDNHLKLQTCTLASQHSALSTSAALIELHPIVSGRVNAGISAAVVSDRFLV